MGEGGTKINSEIHTGSCWQPLSGNSGHISNGEGEGAKISYMVNGQFVHRVRFTFTMALRE